MRSKIAVSIALLSMIVAATALAQKRVRSPRVRVAMKTSVDLNVANLYPGALILSNNMVQTTDPFTMVYNHFRNMSIAKASINGWRVGGHFSPSRMQWMSFALKKSREVAYLWMRSDASGNVIMQVLPRGQRPR